MQRLHVFVDEYGDPNLDLSKEGVSSAYIVAAVCIKEIDLEDAATLANDIRARHFQQGEMKSSSVGANDGRRIALLRDLSRLPGFVISYCARKQAIPPGTGLDFKKSFMKFFAKRLYDRVIRCGEDFRVLMDAHGYAAFQEELQRHFDRAYRRDLFAKPTFSSADSKEHALLQVADLYAGSLARIYDAKKLSERRNELREVLRNDVSITLWPEGRVETLPPLEAHLDENDELIRRYCARRAEAHLAKIDSFSPDANERGQAAFLDALISHHTLGEPGSFLSTQALRHEVSSAVGEPISAHRLRSAIVAKLRDADVIISSCPKGYRLPASAADMREFAIFANSIVPPMVARLGRAQRGIREATFGNVDIFDEAPLEQLRLIVESLHSR